MIPTKEVSAPKLQPHPTSSPQLESEKELSLPVSVKRKASDSGKLEGSVLQKRRVETEPLEKLPDIVEIKELKTLISNLISRLKSGQKLSESVKIKNKELIISLFNLMQSCLESYEANELPERLPYLNNSENLIEDETGLFQQLCDRFEKICHLRSCVNIDQEFIDKVHEYLDGDTCLEVYAGNGWFTSELKRRGCNISATDSFSRFDKEKSKFSPFLRDVRKVKASDAVADFIGKLKENAKEVY